MPTIPWWLCTWPGSPAWQWALSMPSLLSSRDWAIAASVAEMGGQPLCLAVASKALNSGIFCGNRAGGISPGRVTIKLSLLVFCKCPVMWFICCIAHIHLEIIIPWLLVNHVLFINQEIKFWSCLDLKRVNETVFPWDSTCHFCDYFFFFMKPCLIYWSSCSLKGIKSK